MSTSKNVRGAEGRAAQPSAARSGIVMAAGTLVSRVLGLVKVSLIAVALAATGPLSSIFDAANNLPNLLYIMLAGGVFNVVLVPQIIKASKLPDRGVDYLSRLLTLGVLCLLVITVVLTLCSSFLVDLLTQFEGRQQVIAVHFSIWLLPQIFFYGLYALVGQALNANDRFGAYTWAPVLNNVVAIAGILSFITLWGGQNKDHPAPTVDNWSSAQTMLLAGTTTLGVVLQALILLWPLRRLGLKLRPKWGWRGMGFSHTGKIAGWALGTMVIGQLSYLLITWVATGATKAQDGKSVENTAGLFLFNRASDIYILPHSIIVLSVATIFFNRMSRAFSGDDRKAFVGAVSQLTRTVGAITVFGSAALIVLSGQIGTVMGGGDHQAALSMGIAVCILAISSPFLSLNFMFNRVFYVTEDARTPFILQAFLIIFGIGTALAVLLVPREFQIFALLATVSAGNIISPFLSGSVLRRKIGDFEVARIVRSHTQFLVAAVFAAIVGALVLAAMGGGSFIGGSFDGFAWRSTLTALVTLAVVGIVMAGVYWLGLKMMRNRELDTLLTPILGRLSRFAPSRGSDLPKESSESALSDPEPPVQAAPAAQERPVEQTVKLRQRYDISDIAVASAHGGSVYQGVDSLLHRPILVLAATPQAAKILRLRIREILTLREHPEALLILDIWTSGSATYLVATHTTSDELLDLIVQTDTFVEPHFTEVLDLGSLHPRQGGS
ncbi:murein biosynthesis integral membrane protein MurJ [Psychromicrobium lacuslunae]|uniref:murein biosynthesis integral membrane protein MurJ n=1 Tax=Psychromicrobium lacuslunae TaxID=1618207 RepID=UPI0012FEFFA6|nr:lipid II flippase MurJ [Psychromicrobium lacuslunae]